ncbi:alpha/beta-Hydrolases superfamily protein [Artemisia annua]|uniref:Alpha/beta-Hydrolases superfamily protein n=1 Tax=Artemisia annua TaxID=35608 RepID=A0A2U1MIS9_ARTAN|nr:alpha/beta-Hydrolases superfamily protein [Artemisia annua]
MTILLEDIVKAVEAWLKILKEPKEVYADENLDPVLIVPGIAGSILNAKDAQTGNEERVWVRIWEADREFRAKLWCQFDPETGKTVSLDPNISIVVPEDRDGLYAIDCLDPDMVIGRDSVCYFHDMIKEMTSWGYQEGKTLFGFGYDFRQSNRLKETMDRLAAKLEAIYTASGEKKINVITHSMGGLLVKCFMSLHNDIFEKYVKSWIAIAAPFQGAPGYVTSTLMNGMSFVSGWEAYFFVSKWSMHQLLIECPSIYELMACLDHEWEHNPQLQIWKEIQIGNGDSTAILETFSPIESVSIFTQALSVNELSYGGVDIPLPFNKEVLQWANKTREILSSAKLPESVKFYNVYGTGRDTPQSVCYGSADSPVSDLQELPFLDATYINVDGDGTVPVESAKADGLDAEARVGIPGEHRGILCDKHTFRIVRHWLKADHDPFYNPVNDYVILPTLFEVERHSDKGLEVTSLKEEWEIVSKGNDDNREQPMVGSISVSRAGDDESSAEEARATFIVHPESDGKQHIELNAMSVTAGGA